MKLTKITAGLMALTLLTSGITASADDSYGKFVFGEDNFRFTNNAYAFGETYYLTDADGAALQENLSNTELRRVECFLENFDTWGGSCYGMSAVSLLACYDLIDYGQYRTWDLLTKEGPAVSLYDLTLDGGMEKYTKPTEETVSLINYYMLTQFTDAVRQHDASQQFMTEWERIEYLIDITSDGSPAMIGFFGYFNGGTRRGGHAINAVGNTEYGDFTVSEWVADPETGEAYQREIKFDARIQIHDCNISDMLSNVYDTEGNLIATEQIKVDDQWIYLDTEKQSWYMPYYRIGSENGGSLIAQGDPALVNATGFLEGTEEYVREEDFIAILSCDSFNGEHSVTQIDYADGAWSDAQEITAEIVDGASYLGMSITDSAWQYTLSDAESGYVLRTDANEDLDLAMDYENCLLIMGSSAGSEAVFHPDGYMEISGTSGESADYSLEMVWNDGYYSGSWYDFSVSGNADSVSLRKTEDGYLLTADNFESVTAFAHNDNAQANLTFSIDADSVLLYEVNETTLAAAIDSDGDGSYETTIAQTSHLGDLDYSGSADATDAAAILIAAAAEGSGSASGLTDEQKVYADVNTDGAFDANDAALILEYAAYAGSGGTLTIEEYLRQG